MAFCGRMFQGLAPCFWYWSTGGICLKVGQLLAHVQDFSAETGLAGGFRQLSPCLLTNLQPNRNRGLMNDMTDSQIQEQVEAIDCTIALAEAALRECDRQGFFFAAIDISSALDKLKAIRSTAEL